MQGTENAAVLEDQTTTDGPDADFDGGFSGTATPTATPENTEPELVQPAAEGAQANPEEVPAPEYVQITKQDFERLNTSAAAVEELRATLTSQTDKTFGKIGGIERMLKDLQTSTPAGEKVELSDEDMAEFAAEYPELASLQRTVLNKALSRVNLRGTGQDVSPEKLTELVKQHVDPMLKGIGETVERTVESRLLSRDHPDWKEIVDAGKPDSKNPYRTWLASQPAVYQQEVGNTISSSVISDSIIKFKASVKVQEAISKRQSRIEGAVTPKGAGGAAASAPDADDDFNAGFKSG